MLPIARVLPDPAGRLPGEPMGDVYKHAWAYWHTLATLGDWPRTDLLGAPGGGVLLDLMAVPALLLAPVAALAGPVAAANLWVWLSLFAAGTATFALCRDVGAKPLPAAAAALGAQSAPFLLGYPLASGVHERLAVWVFPLVALCAIRLREERWGRWVALASAGLFVASAGCQGYGLYVAAMGILGFPIWWPAGARRLAVLGLALGAVLAGVWLGTRALTDSPLALVPRPGETAPTWGVAAEVAWTPSSWRGLFDPWAAREQRPMGTGEEVWWLAYLGGVPVLAALAGAWVGRRTPFRSLRARIRGVLVASRQVFAPGSHRCAASPSALKPADANMEPTSDASFRRRPRNGSTGLAVIGFLFALLSLGPWPALGPWRVVNPLFVALSWVIPRFGSYAPSWQMVAAFAPLTAPAVAALLGRAGAAGAVGYLTLALGERMVALPVPLVQATVEARAAAPYAAVTEDGALVEIPRVVADRMLTDGRMFLGQTAHDRPIAATVNLGNAAFDWYLPVARGAARSWGEAADCLRRSGFRWVALRRGSFSRPDLAEGAREGLAHAAGPPVADDGDLAIFDLGPARAPARAPPPVPVQSRELLAAGIVGGPIDLGRIRGVDPFACPVH